MSAQQNALHGFLRGTRYRESLQGAAKIHVLRRCWLLGSVMVPQELVVLVFFSPVSPGCAKSCNQAATDSVKIFYSVPARRQKCWSDKEEGDF